MFFLFSILAVLTIFLLFIIISGLVYHIAKQAITVAAKIGLAAVLIFAFVFIFFCILTFLILILGFLFVPF